MSITVNVATTGVPGPSAYDIAVIHGYTGTEAEWNETVSDVITARDLALVYKDNAASSAGSASASAITATTKATESFESATDANAARVAAESAAAAAGALSYEDTLIGLTLSSLF